MVWVRGNSGRLHECARSKFCQIGIHYGVQYASLHGQGDKLITKYCISIVLHLNILLNIKIFVYKTSIIWKNIFFLKNSLKRFYYYILRFLRGRTYTLYDTWYTTQVIRPSTRLHQDISRKMSIIPQTLVVSAWHHHNALLRQVESLWTNCQDHDVSLCVNWLYM